MAIDPTERIRQNVAKMRAQGATDAEVESYLRDYEGLSPVGEVTSVGEGRSFDMDPQAAGLARAREVGDRQMGFERALVSSPLGPWSDELAGVLRGARNAVKGGSFKEGYREGQTEHIAELDAAPAGARIAGTVAGLIPAALAPVGAARALVQRGAGLLSAGAAGAATGAAGGALLGAGEQEGGGAANAGGGAVIGAVTGGLLGGGTATATAATRRSAGRGARVSDMLQRTTGTRVNLNAARDAADAGVEAVRKAHYQHLEEAFPEVADDALVSLLRSPNVRGHTRAIAPDVATGKRAPSFQEAQSILLRMARINKRGGTLKEEVDQVNGALEKAVRGYRQADAAYREAIALRNAVTAGRQAWNKSAADIERTTRGMTPAVREQFRQGQLHEIVRRLETRDEAASGVLRQWMDAGPEMQRVIRTLFRDDASFDAFKREIAKERSAAAVSAAYRKYGPIAAAALGGGALGASLIR